MSAPSLSESSVSKLLFSKLKDQTEGRYRRQDPTYRGSSSDCADQGQRLSRCGQVSANLTHTRSFDNLHSSVICWHGQPASLDPWEALPDLH